MKEIPQYIENKEISHIQIPKTSTPAIINPNQQITLQQCQVTNQEAKQQVPGQLQLIPLPHGLTTSQMGLFGNLNTLTVSNILKYKKQQTENEITKLVELKEKQQEELEKMQKKQLDDEKIKKEDIVQQASIVSGLGMPCTPVSPATSSTATTSTATTSTATSKPIEQSQQRGKYISGVKRNVFPEGNDTFDEENVEPPVKKCKCGVKSSKRSVTTVSFIQKYFLN